MGCLLNFLVGLLLTIVFIPIRLALFIILLVLKILTWPFRRRKAPPR